jgi:adenine-specific DNA-methyltransferase
MIRSAENIIEFSQELQRRWEAGTSLEHRKQFGQFFTPPSICRFMAGLFSLPNEQFRLLDPGAGVGALTAAVCERFGSLNSSRHLEVHLFESDSAVVPLLEENMQLCRCSVETAGHTMEYFIHATDFIVEAGEEFGNRRDLFSRESALGRFDGVIMNPPYFKIAKDSLHSRLMASVVHGQPNIYALFLALGAHLLSPGGEMVAITPRSFCNGLYFRDFRQWFLQRMSIEHLHLFESRTDTFEGAGVLQESVISVSRRSKEQSSEVRISTSVGADFQEATPQSLPAAKVIDSPARGRLIRIPASSQDAEVMELVESLPTRFAETGLRISTGPVVLFRAKEFLVEEPHGPNTVPLLLPHNIKPLETIWPIKKQRKPIAFLACADSRRLLLPARNYVLIKRFSSKEERRRLTAGCFFGARQSCKQVALENHLNYIYHDSRELSEEEVFGIAAFLNSAVFDRYFRLMSGSTQVNATELRTMKFAPLDAVKVLGQRVRALGHLREAAVEDVVRETLAWDVSRVLMESLI